MFRLAQADPHLGASAAKRNWVRAWETKRNECALMGAPLARPGLPYHLVPVAASKFGRAVAFVRWQQEGRSRNSITLVSAPCNAGDQPSHLPTRAVAELYERFLAPLTSLGTHRAFTPLSAHGPGCSGSIPTRTNMAARRVGPIMWARTGAAAMTSPLFKLGPLHGDSHAARLVQCHLCHGTTPLDFYHLANECIHPAIKSWRRRCGPSLRQLVYKLTTVLLRERDRAGHEPEDNLLSRAARAVRRVELNSAEGDFLTYRFLLAHPWPERMALPHMRAVRLLGRVFDLPGVYHRFERPAIDLWCRWSERWLWKLSVAWRVANN